MKPMSVISRFVHPFIVSASFVCASFFYAPCIAAQTDVYVGGSEADDYDDGYYGENGTDDGLPIVYAGDGMRIRVDQFDDSGTIARGTLTLGNAAPMPLEFQMHETPKGLQHQGQVRTPSGMAPFRGWDESEDVTVVEYAGRRYRLFYQDEFAGTYGVMDPDPRQPAAQPFQPGQQQVYPQTQPLSEQPQFQQPHSQQPHSQQPHSQQPHSQQARSQRATVKLKHHNLGGTHTLLVPEGWQVQGGVWQPPVEAFNWLPSRNIVVTAPDGSQIHFRADFKALDHRPAAMAPPQPGSINRERGILHMPMPGNAQEWASWVERETRSTGGQISSVRSRPAEIEPELTQQLRRLHAPMTQFALAQATPDSRMQIDQLALTVRSNVIVAGQPWEQVDAFSNLYAIGQLNSVFGGLEHFNFWDISNAVSMRAPQGQLERQLPLMLAVVNSLRTTPEWTRQLVDLKVKLSGINHDMAMDSINTSAQIAAQTYRAGQEISAIMNDGYQRRNAASDAGQRKFVNHIRDMQDYNDRGGVVTLPHGYANVFSNGQGEYLLTNDAFFEPDPDWARLRVRQ